jgi:hypothetical protein
VHRPVAGVDHVRVAVRIDVDAVQAAEPPGTGAGLTEREHRRDRPGGVVDAPALDPRAAERLRGPQVAVVVDGEPRDRAGQIEVVEEGARGVVLADVTGGLPVSGDGEVRAAVARVDRERGSHAAHVAARVDEVAEPDAVGRVPPDLVRHVVAHDHLVGHGVVGEPPCRDAGPRRSTDDPLDARRLPWHGGAGGHEARRERGDGQREAGEGADRLHRGGPAPGTASEPTSWHGTSPGCLGRRSMNMRECRCDTLADL